MDNFDQMMKEALDRLKLHEGFRSKPYKDTVGKLTIGYGRNLDDVGISEKEAEVLLANDYMKSAKWVEEWVNTGVLDKHMEEDENTHRLLVLIEMVFNMGHKGVLKFKETFKAINDKDWDKAAERMLKSKWATQVGKRAKTLAEVMRTGKHATA